VDRIDSLGVRFEPPSIRLPPCHCLPERRKSNFGTHLGITPPTRPIAKFRTLSLYWLKDLRRGSIYCPTRHRASVRRSGQEGTQPSGLHLDGTALRSHMFARSVHVGGVSVCSVSDIASLDHCHEHAYCFLCHDFFSYLHPNSSPPNPFAPPTTTSYARLPHARHQPPHSHTFASSHTLPASSPRLYAPSHLTSMPDNELGEYLAGSKRNR
jgi:hypothetical protein